MAKCSSPKKRKTKRGPEATLKAQLIPMLESSGLLWWRNQTYAGPVIGGRYMIVGTPGIPDLMLFARNGTLICVELKSAVGTLNPDQVQFFARIEEFKLADPSGTKHVEIFIVRTVDQMRAVLAFANNGNPPEMTPPGKRKYVQYEPKTT